jgi:hypothetical protein
MDCLVKSGPFDIKERLGSIENLTELTCLKFKSIIERHLESHRINQICI